MAQINVPAARIAHEITSVDQTIGDTGVRLIPMTTNVNAQ
jgi:hypothetical protein